MIYLITSDALNPQDDIDGYFLDNFIVLEGDKKPSLKIIKNIYDSIDKEYEDWELENCYDTKFKEWLKQNEGKLHQEKLYLYNKLSRADKKNINFDKYIPMSFHFTFDKDAKIEKNPIDVLKRRKEEFIKLGYKVLDFEIVRALEDELDEI